MPKEPARAPSDGQALAAVAAAAQEFAAQSATLLLGTVDADGEAHLSYAPYVGDGEGGYYLLVSDLAPHTAHLRRRGQAEVLFIEEESAARNLFARQRLSLRCRVAEIARNDPRHAPALEAMAERLGDTVTLLRGLADFRLLQLQPRAGRYVVGFGRAYAIAVEAGVFQASGPRRPADEAQSR